MSEKITNNSISLLRVMAAVQVMFGHMVEHLGLPIDKVLFHNTYFIRGVPIFFVLSGYLIWFSIARSHNYKEFICKRFFRIYPELWVSVVMELLVLVFLYTEYEVMQLILFAICQATFFQFWTPESLRGYGVGSPNGALWTIGIMIQFYIIAWYLRDFLKQQKLFGWLLGFFITFIISWGIGEFFHDYINQVLLEKLYNQTIIRFLWLFYFGMFLANYNEKLLPLLIKYWHLLLFIAFLFFKTKCDLFSGYYLGWSIFLTSGLIGFSYKFPRLSVRPDISYAIFLYHMIIFNIFVHLHLLGDWNFAIKAIGITIVFAIISTLTIGKISFSRKQIVNNRKN